MRPSAQRLRVAIADAALALDAMALDAGDDRARRQLADVDPSRAADALETLALVARRLEGAGDAGGPFL